jgi:hypothetical protein
VFAGRVAAGESCAGDDECREPALACLEPRGSECGRRCLPRPALGADCSGGPCVSGAYCRLLRTAGAPASFRCEALPADGQPCADECAAGLFCAREAYDGLEGLDEGICRPRLADGPCKNDWHCPWPLLCLRDSGATTGRCGSPPVAQGMACTPGLEECAPGSSCRPLGGGFACQPAPGPGAPCGYLEVAPGKSEAVDCAGAFCDLSAGIRRGVCVGLRAAGASCRATLECADGLACLSGPGARMATCQRAGQAAVTTCDFWNRCGPAQRCQAGACVPMSCGDPGAALEVVAGQPARGAFRAVLVHGPASRQPTPLGRRLAALEPWRGRLYFGYGDYDGNTGPISVSSFDPAAHAVTEELSFETEAIALYRPLGDRLYAPAIDPRGAASPTYAFGAPWTPVAAFAATHVFDMAGGGEVLWAAGSAGNDAVVWRSGDGGAHFDESLREQSTGGTFFMRYYFLGALGTKLYVQAVPSETGQSRVFDGNTWGPGPNLLPLGGQGWSPRAWKGLLLYLSWQPIGPHGGTLLAFDGAVVRPALPHEVLDFTVQLETVYVLASDGRVKRSSDLGHWRTLGVAPTGARSIAVLDGRLYVGGTDGRLFVLEDDP